MKKSSIQLYRKFRALKRELDKYHEFFYNIPSIASKMQSILDVLCAGNVPIQSRVDVCRSSVYELLTILNKIVYEQENCKN